MTPISGLLDLDRYPLDRPDSEDYAALVVDSRSQLALEGLFNLDAFLRPDAVARALAELEPRCTGEAYLHARRHNVYFEKSVAGLAAAHPALVEFETVNRTLCGDQLVDTVVQRVYDWNPLSSFLARVMDKPELHAMADPLARVNVMAYGDGATLNWHFDRSQFTTTLLLQAAEAGGEFEYHPDLRSDDDPNYEGVARVLDGRGGAPRVNPLAPGTLNVFAGRNTLHRVSTVRGRRDRVIAVFSYYDRPAVQFSETERRGFYGRAS